MKKIASDQTTLCHPALPRELIWDWDNDSEPELDIHYKAQSQPARSSDSDDSENAPLLSRTRVSGKIIPNRLEVTFGVKTSTVVLNKKNVARKTIARKTQEPREHQKTTMEHNTRRNYNRLFHPHNNLRYKHKKKHCHSEK